MFPSVCQDVHPRMSAFQRANGLEDNIKYSLVMVDTVPAQYKHLLLLGAVSQRGRCRDCTDVKRTPPEVSHQQLYFRQGVPLLFPNDIESWASYTLAHHLGHVAVQAPGMAVVFSSLLFTLSRTCSVSWGFLRKRFGPPWELTSRSFQ